MTGLWLIAIGLMLVGLIGTVLPGIPGLPLVVAGGVLFAVGSGFDVIGPWQLGGFVGLGLLGMALSFVGMPFEVTTESEPALPTALQAFSFAICFARTASSCLRATSRWRSSNDTFPRTLASSCEAS